MSEKQENKDIEIQENNADLENSETEELQATSVINQNIVFKVQKKMLKGIINFAFFCYLILFIQELNLLSFIREWVPLCNLTDVVWAKYTCLGLTILALVLLTLNLYKKIKWWWFCGVFVIILGFIFIMPEPKPKLSNIFGYSDCSCSGDYAKPIIYLYPTEQSEVTVKLGNPQNLTHTYPKYTDKWQVVAQPNGDLTDIKTNRSLYALYWEGINHNKPETKEGFVVKGEDTISFLEEKLALLGLNEREANEFIIYWLPKLESSPYNYIYFKTIAEQDKNMPLYISPKPDTVIRVMMAFKNLNEPIEVTEQILPPTPQRDGFTVVEWGGTDLMGNIVK